MNHLAQIKRPNTILQFVLVTFIAIGATHIEVSSNSLRVVQQASGYSKDKLLILEKPVLETIGNKTDLLGISSVHGACCSGCVQQIPVRCKEDSVYEPEIAELSSNLEPVI